MNKNTDCACTRSYPSLKVYRNLDVKSLVEVNRELWGMRSMVPDVARARCG